MFTAERKRKAVSEVPACRTCDGHRACGLCDGVIDVAVAESGIKLKIVDEPEAQPRIAGQAIVRLTARVELRFQCCPPQAGIHTHVWKQCALIAEAEFIAILRTSRVKVVQSVEIQVLVIGEQRKAAADIC